MRFHPRLLLAACALALLPASAHAAPRATAADARAMLERAVAQVHEVGAQAAFAGTSYEALVSSLCQSGIRRAGQCHGERPGVAGDFKKAHCVGGGARMGESQSNRAPRREQGCSPGLVRVGQQEGIAADAEQFVMQVLSHELAGANAEQQYAVGLIDRGHHALQGPIVETRNGFIDSQDFQRRHLGRHLPKGVGLGDLGAKDEVIAELGGFLAKLCSEVHA